jgi:RNA polymerase primary sigma factor
MSSENLAAANFYSQEETGRWPDVYLVPDLEEDLEGVDTDSLGDYHLEFKIPRKIPKGYAKTRHLRPDPDKEPPIVDGVVDGYRVVLNENKLHPLLTAEEEIDLAKRIEKGDLEAKEKLFNSNLRLVISIANRYPENGLKNSDIIQEGMAGLMRAVEKFDWRKGFKFSTYATLWIRQSIGRGLVNTGQEIRVPVHLDQKIRKINRIKQELNASLGHEPSYEEIAAAAKMSVEEVTELSNVPSVVTSLDKSVNDKGEETELGALLPDTKINIHEQVVEEIEVGLVEEIVNNLPEKVSMVIKMRFGIDTGEPPLPQKVVARRLGITLNEAIEIEERGLKYLARNSKAQTLRESNERGLPTAASEAF